MIDHLIRGRLIFKGVISENRPKRAKSPPSDKAWLQLMLFDNLEPESPPASRATTFLAFPQVWKTLDWLVLPTTSPALMPIRQSERIVSRLYPEPKRRSSTPNTPPKRASSHLNNEKHKIKTPNITSFAAVPQITMRIVDLPTKSRPIALAALGAINPQRQIYWHYCEIYCYLGGAGRSRWGQISQYCPQGPSSSVLSCKLGTRVAISQSPDSLPST